MTIKIGDRIPDGTLGEYVEKATEGREAGPNGIEVANEVKGKKIAVFAVPGAFTPTCSAQHLPGYLERCEQLKFKGIDEIWCVAVNDPFVMHAWSKDQNVGGRVRMLADGNGDWTRKLGLEFDLTGRGLGVRSQRYSMLLDDGVVTQLNVDQSGKLESSDAQTLLTQCN
jgi:peroxiredoxin